jgi:LuxR family maltose regulon positive regulatory protein
VSKWSLREIVRREDAMSPAQSAGESAASRPSAPPSEVASTPVRPVAAADIVDRRRLLELVQQGVRGPLTLVTAPAGYGKTVLVNAWAARHREQDLIVSTRLDDDAPDASDFWTRLLAGLRSGGVNVSDVHLDGASRVVDPPTLLVMARSIAAHADPVVWVLDCAEHLLAPALAAGLDRLIAGSSGRLHVIILTRADPPLPLHRYRLDGAITEIRAADLAFTASEASLLMQRAGLDVAPADLNTLRARTGGWPAGLRFAAMALAGRGDTAQAIRAFRGDTENVAGYLMSEVLDRQPPAMREFLLRTCLVHELEPGLVEALTGRPAGSRVLTFIAHGNAFVEPVPGRRDHFRYQPLFREFLRSQLLFEMPALVPVLRRAAAEWFIQSGQPLAAIREAALAQAWPMAAHYVIESAGYARLLTGRQRGLVEALFARLPADAAGAEVALTRAALALAQLDPRRAAADLDAARMLAERGEALGREGRLASIVLETVTASLGNDVEGALNAAVAAESALQRWPAHDPVAHAEVTAVVAACKGMALVQLGRFAAARDALDKGIREAHAHAISAARVELQGMAALAEAMAGNLRRATALASSLVPVTDEPVGDDQPGARAATLALAWVRLDEYDLPAAERLLRHAERADPSVDAGMLGKAFALVQGRLWGARGEVDLARSELAAARRVTVGTSAGWLDRSLLAAEAELSPGAPEGTADEPSAEPSESDTLAVQVHGWLIRAAAAMRRGESSRAEASLERALMLAAPEHLRRPFIEAPQDVRDLLERRRTGAHRWLEVAVTAPGDAAGAAERQSTHGVGGGSGPASLVNPLTKKEEEVLGHLAELLTTEEIAAAMFVSVNTVRSHVRSILRKLGVTRRNEAVRRAWDLQLLTPPPAA